LKSNSKEKPQFEPEDMSVKETEFVDSEFNVDAETFCGIKNYLWDDLLASSKKAAEKAAFDAANKSVCDKLKQQLTEELMPSLVLKAEEAAKEQAFAKAKALLEPQLRKELATKLNEERLLSFPTADEQKAYQKAYRDIEVESITFAASAALEAEKQRPPMWQGVWPAILAAALIGIGPYILWLLSRGSAEQLPFWLMLLPYTTFTKVAVARTIAKDRVKDEYQKAQDTLRKLSSEYLQLASRLRAFRQVTIATENRKDLQVLGNSIIREKERLDSTYKPSVPLVEEVKPLVRVRLSDEVDPETLAEEFDVRLTAASKAK